MPRNRHAFTSALLDPTTRITGAPRSYTQLVSDCANASMTIESILGSFHEDYFRGGPLLYLLVVLGGQRLGSEKAVYERIQDELTARGRTMPALTRMRHRKKQALESWAKQEGVSLEEARAQYEAAKKDPDANAEVYIEGKEARIARMASTAPETIPVIEPKEEDPSDQDLPVPVEQQSQEHDDSPEAESRQRGQEDEQQDEHQGVENTSVQISTSQEVSFDTGSTNVRQEDHHEQAHHAGRGLQPYHLGHAMQPHYSSQVLQPYHPGHGLQAYHSGHAHNIVYPPFPQQSQHIGYSQQGRPMSYPQQAHPIGYTSYQHILPREGRAPTATQLQAAARANAAALLPREERTPTAAQLEVAARANAAARGIAFPTGPFRSEAERRYWDQFRRRAREQQDELNTRRAAERLAAAFPPVVLSATTNAGQSRGAPSIETARAAADDNPGGARQEDDPNFSYFDHEMAGVEFGLDINGFNFQ